MVKKKKGEDETKPKKDLVGREKTSDIKKQIERENKQLKVFFKMTS